MEDSAPALRDCGDGGVGTVSESFQRCFEGFLAGECVVEVGGRRLGSGDACSLASIGD